MTLDEALSLAIEGERMTGDHMMTGQYVEHMLSRGYVRCWPVDRPENEPSRTQCDFIPNDRDRAANWSILERPKVDSWGKPIDDVSRGLNVMMREMGVDPEEVSKAVPWGDLKLNTPEAMVEAVATVQPLQDAARSAWGIRINDQPATAEDVAAIGRALDDDDGGYPLAPAPKRDSWGRPID